jgi:hypothetical protein
MLTSFQTKCGSLSRLSRGPARNCQQLRSAVRAGLRPPELQASVPPVGPLLQREVSAQPEPESVLEPALEPGQLQPEPELELRQLGPELALVLPSQLVPERLAAAGT